MFDKIYVNEHGNEYQVNLIDINGKKTYIICVKTADEEKFKTLCLAGREFDTEQEAYDHAINNIKNDYKKE